MQVTIEIFTIGTKADTTALAEYMISPKSNN